MGELDSNVVIVTGASKGMGREMSLRFAEEGANVVLVARTRDDLEAVADEIARETLVAPADVTDSQAAEAVVEQTLDRFGRVDTLVNNAASGLLQMRDRAKLVHEVTPEEWKSILTVNLDGVFYFTRAVLPAMVDAERGNIINISSGLGRDVYKVGESAWAPYTASKWGMEALTKVTALDYENDGINANSLDPGGRVDTAFWDHLPDEARSEILDPDVMNDAAVLLAAQGPEGVSGEGMNAKAWENRLG